MAFLTSKTLHFGNGQTIHANFSECLADFIEFEGFNDGCNLFHDDFQQ